MLVLARREKEKVRIAGEIYVTVLSVTGKIVRLGFDAPDGVRIERVVEAKGDTPKRDD